MKRQIESDQLITELADLFEVVDALITSSPFTRQDVIAMQQKRRESRGGFERRIKLLWTE